MVSKIQRVPKEYVWRRLHSLFGLLIVFFLIEHIITNSQAALFFGENGAGFVRMVNLIKNLPYLPIIEITLIGVPILFHGVWGVIYALSSKPNSMSSKGNTPSLNKYPRNHAYTWQRITSWILLLGIILHVGYMRFYRYPTHAQVGTQNYYFTRVSVNKGLYTVASRLGVKLYSKADVEKIKASYEHHKAAGRALEKKADSLYSSEQKTITQESLNRLESAHPLSFSEKDQILLDQAQNFRQKTQWVKALTKRPLKDTEVIAEAKDFGTAVLIMVRDSFRSPIKGALYTIFVLAAAFHAFNGLWTFLITWGLVIKMRSQRTMVNVCTGLMVVIALLGLAAVWGTYWINLYR